MINFFDTIIYMMAPYFASIQSVETQKIQNYIKPVKDDKSFWKKNIKQTVKYFFKHLNFGIHQTFWQQMSL